MEKYVEEYLQNNGIEYTLYEHPAVFTCEEAEKFCKDVPGLACKNLFLRDKESQQFFLVIMPASNRLEFRKLERALGKKKLTFGGEEELFETLHLTPGAVSPLGIINDAQRTTTVVIDAKVWNADTVSFHPNINTESIALSNDAFRRLIESLKTSVKLVALD